MRKTEQNRWPNLRKLNSTLDDQFVSVIFSRWPCVDRDIVCAILSLMAGISVDVSSATWPGQDLQRGYTEKLLTGRLRGAVYRFSKRHCPKRRFPGLVVSLPIPYPTCGTKGMENSKLIVALKYVCMTQQYVPINDISRIFHPVLSYTLLLKFSS